MPGSRSLLERRDAVVARGVPRISSLAVASASGAELRDHDGRTVIDFAGGIGVLNVGHCHPEVVRAIQEQAAELIHTCIHVATYEPYVRLCEELVRLLPHGDATKALLVNSGAEAVENAVKIARQATGRPGVLCYTEGFHGRTLLGMTLTSKVGYKTGCGPFAPEVYRIRYPNRYRYGDGLGEEAFAARELERLEESFSNLSSDQNLAAILIEAVQGEGGFVPAPVAYMQGLRRICDARGILLICDEVQAGFCRTGRWASYEHSGIVPDLSVWAKSLGGGMPIAAVLGKAAVMDSARPGTIGGTFGGNPVACAAALAAIRVMESMGLNERAMQIGATVERTFRDLSKRTSSIGDVRGRGAMIGVELVEDAAKTPATKLTAQVMRLAEERGVLLIGAGTHGNILRILSPLTISDETLRKGLEIVGDALLEAAESTRVRA